MVLLGSGDPIVLCAIDWIGIANEGYDRFREALPDNMWRVAAHPRVTAAATEMAITKANSLIDQKAVEALNLRIHKHSDIEK